LEITVDVVADGGQAKEAAGCADAANDVDDT
jgi:hypothetical protein